MTTTEENLEWIYTRWTDLRATMLRGTPKPWREPTLTAEQRARIDALARTEKLERGAFTLGESPAPVHLDALDHAIDLTRTMARLARATATELGHHAVLIRAATHRYDDPLLLIRYLKAHFDQLAAGVGEDIQEEAAIFGPDSPTTSPKSPTANDSKQTAPTATSPPSTSESSDPSTEANQSSAASQASANQTRAAAARGTGACQPGHSTNGTGWSSRSKRPTNAGPASEELATSVRISSNGPANPQRVANPVAKMRTGCG
jgi:hypothetical protein